MKRMMMAVALSGVVGAGAAEEEFATPRDAEQLVAKVVSAMRGDVPKVYAGINAKDGAWVHGDLYPVVYDLQGVVLAHGQNRRMVGRNLLEIHDADGRSYIRERLELAKTKSSFWQSYSFIDPVGKSILPKRMYCQRLQEAVVCAGVYQR